MPHERARHRHRRLGRAGPWAWRVASGRAWLVFCHLIHITMGVTPLDGGGELITAVTVSSASVSLCLSPGILRCLSSPRSYIRLRLLGFSAASLLPVHISESSVSPQKVIPQPLPREPHFRSLLVSPSRTSAHGVAGEQVPPEPSSA